jgi:hypothetical protein
MAIIAYVLPYYTVGGQGANAPSDGQSVGDGGAGGGGGGGAGGGGGGPGHKN